MVTVESSGDAPDIVVQNNEEEAPALQEENRAAPRVADKPSGSWQLFPQMCFLGAAKTKTTVGKIGRQEILEHSPGDIHAVSGTREEIFNRVADLKTPLTGSRATGTARSGR